MPWSSQVTKGEDSKRLSLSHQQAAEAEQALQSRALHKCFCAYFEGISYQNEKNPNTSLGGDRRRKVVISLCRIITTCLITLVLREQVWIWRWWDGEGWVQNKGIQKFWSTFKQSWSAPFFFFFQKVDNSSDFIIHLKYLWMRALVWL